MCSCKAGDLTFFRPETPEKPKSLVDRHDPDIVITDVVMPEISGLELLRDLKAGNPQRPVLLITARGSIDMAVEAIKQGARDFLTKPVTDFTKLKALLDDAEREIELRRKTKRLATNVETEGLFGDFVGASKPMREVFNLIEMVAGRDVSVIVTGESGTGKELVARAIHRLSARCGQALRRGQRRRDPRYPDRKRGLRPRARARLPAPWARARDASSRHTAGPCSSTKSPRCRCRCNQSSCEFSPTAKVRRLGGHHEFEFDVRVVVATNRNPLQAVKEGKLREDLFYRLNVFSIALPPLRERPDDVPLLAQRFIKEFNAKHRTTIEGISDEAADELKKYPWPGNVRELRNVIERAVVLTKSDWIDTAVLPPYIRSSAPSNQKLVLDVGTTTMADAERELIIRTLERTGNNKAEAARQLGVDVKTIYNKLKAYNIES